MKNYCEMGKGYADTIAECHNLPKEMRDHIETAYVQGARAVSVYSGLSLNDYQEKAMTTCMESCDNTMYMLTEICSETGELQGKFAKAIRKGQIEFYNNEFTSNMHSEEYSVWITDVIHEVGDILWGIAGLARVLNCDLETVAKENLDKLASRMKRGVIEGNGDNR